MIPWLKRNRQPIEEPVAEGAEEAKQAKAEARHRRAATLEVLRLREDMLTRNHIADDIGRAYRIINERT